jgi:hypothetical protein
MRAFQRDEVAMKFPAVVTIVAAALFPAALSAHPLYLFGEIGKSKVMAALDREGDALMGWYLYLDIGKPLRLAGRIDAAGDFQLDETVDLKKTGRLQGKMDGGHWTGEWRKPDGGSPLPFTLSESRDTLAGVSGAFRCSSKRRDKDGWTYAHSLQLELAKGAVKALDAGLSESSTNEGQQGCFYSLKDFSEVPTDAGVLLKAKDEDDPITEDSQHCTIRIVGDADTLFLQFGDLTEKNDDCRFSGATAFCSPRSWMAEVIVDRKTKSCRAVGE